MDGHTDYSMMHLEKEKLAVNMEDLELQFLSQEEKVEYLDLSSWHSISQESQVFHISAED